jgi:hypothetical protein
MSVADTYKEWKSHCRCCGFSGKIWGWQTKLPLECPTCGEHAEPVVESFNTSSGIICDDIPGGIDIRHGICHPDGTPKRYYSKTEMRRAANEKGLVMGGDTPGKPYKVHWSGKRDE